MQQTGYVFRAGNWWYLRYRDTVLAHGTTKRQQLTHKLARVAPGDRRLKRAPDNVVILKDEFLRPLNQNSYTPESTQTLADFVDHVYFPHAAEQKRASTLFTDRNRWEKHLKPRCGHVRLRDFRTVTGEQLIAEIARQNDLSRATLKQMKSSLSAVFTHAKRVGFLDGTNPMQGVSIPKARESKETYAYDLDEVNKMLTILSQPALTIVAVASFAGLRRGEIQGLRWENYDGHSLSVCQSVWEGKLSEPKTRSSKRRVQVIEYLARILDVYHFARGSPPSGVMFPARSGKPLRLNNLLRNQILPVLKKAGLEFHGWHGFRRGLATNLHDMGVDDHTIKDILRHSNVGVTQNSYIKTVPRQSIEAMSRFNERLNTLKPPAGDVCNSCATEMAATEPDRVN